MSSKKIIQAIRKYKTFLISTHVNPDPDALCSELALTLCLRARGKKVFIVNHDQVPARLRIFPGSAMVKKYQEKMRIQYDAAIILDCGELARVGDVERLISNDKLLINIDHHITNDLFGHLNFVKPQASSTAEILYELFKEGRYTLTKNIAINLYAGILTDTGSFR